MTVRASLTERTLPAIAGTALQFIAQLALFPVVIRILTPAEYGLVAVVLVMANVGSALLTVGLPAAITRKYFAASGPEQSRTLLLVAVVPALTCGLLLTVALAHRSAALMSVNPPELILAVWLSVSLSIVQLCQSTLRAEGRVTVYAKMQLMATAGGQTLGVLLLLVLPPAPLTYLAGPLAGAVLAAIMSWRSVSRGASPTLSRTSLGPLLKWALRYGLPTLPQGLAVLLLSFGDRLLIERILGLDAVGTYQVAYVMGSVGFAVIAAVNVSWAPLVHAVESPDDKLREWNDSTRAVVTSSCWLVVAMSLAIPLIVPIVVPAGYAELEVIVLATVITSATAPLAFASAYSVALYESGNTLGLAVSAVSAALFNLGLNVALLPVLGVLGAALATSLSYVVQASVLWELVRRTWDVQLRGPTAQAAVATVASVLLAVVPATAWTSFARLLALGIVVAILARSIRTSPIGAMLQWRKDN